MNKIFLGLGVVTLSAVAPQPSYAAALPSGSYQATCVDAYADGAVLTATCSTGTNVWKTTQLEYGSCTSEVWNAYGHLVCVNGRPVGSYERSCESITFDGNWLKASCRTMSGSYQGTRIDVPSCTGDIANINGVLKCSDYSCSYNVSTLCWYGRGSSDYYYLNASQQCGVSQGDAASHYLPVYPQCNESVPNPPIPCCEY